VPDREAYDDWKNVKGFSLVGPTSFFPHMDDVWQRLVNEMSSQLEETESVLALRDDEVCCVHGRKVEILSYSLEQLR
jgi:hypothetical protein